MKNKIKIGDLVDVHPAVKQSNTGLAIVLDHEYDDDEESVKYFTLLWNDGQLSIAHRVNIIPTT